MKYIMNSVLLLFDTDIALNKNNLMYDKIFYIASFAIIISIMIYYNLKFLKSNKEISILNKRLKDAYSISHVGIWTGNSDSKYLNISNECLEIFNILPEDINIIGSENFLSIDVLHEKYINDANSKKDFIDAVKKLESGEINIFNKHYTYKAFGDPHKLMHMEIILSLDETKKDLSRIGIARDITKEYLCNKQLLQINTTDNLTSAKNRSAIYQIRIENLFGKFMGYLDLDDFKKVNDTYGHNIGDDILKNIVCTLRNCHETHDVFRMGGDEFIIILNDFNDKIAKNLMSIVETPVMFENYSFVVRSSFGFLKIERNNQFTLEESLNLANYAMTLAKDKGKNTYVLINKKIIGEYLEKIKLEGLLLGAIKNGDIVPFFQPYFNIKTKKIIGFEALMRWKREHEILSPCSFLSIAIKSGLIYDIDILMFKKSAEFLRELLSKGLVDKNFTVSSNFTAITLMRVNVKFMVEIVDKIGIDPSNMSIEVTEQILINEKAFINIKKIKASGFKIAIDDFSAGHSSLTALKKFEADILKIDKTLLDDVLENNQNYQIFKTIVDLGKSLNSKIISEGVEDILHEEVLIKNDVFIVQGFYYAKPCSKNDFEKLLYQIKCD